MANTSEVPDPKSGRDSSPQNPDAVQQYTLDVISMTYEERMNELKALKAYTSFIRRSMNELQLAAGRARNLYGVVPEDLRDSLIASRNAYREHQVKIRIFNLHNQGEEE